jgi:DNA-binding MarR family transcriptional regulator
MEKKWWPNVGMWFLVAQDDSITPTELRLLVGLMGLHEDGPVTLSQQKLADQIGMERSKVNKAIMGLLEAGYIHREGKTYTIDGSLMFTGRRNQQNKKVRVHLNDNMRERRKAFYEKVASEGPDNSLGWPGYSADGKRFDATMKRGWRFYGSAHQESEDPEGSH